MTGIARLRLAAYGLLVGGLCSAAGWLISCSVAPAPIPIIGSGSQTGNDLPELTITDPASNVTVDQGRNFLIRWTDSDPDDNAQITFSLVNTVTNQVIILVTGLDENDTVGPDQFTIGTSLVPIGSYNLLGTIDDGVNPPVSVFAQVGDGTSNQRVIVQVVEPGQGPPTVPPIVTVLRPAFNQSVAQDDNLDVLVQPTALDPAVVQIPYDPDSLINMYVLLDTDLNPNNDDPANPDPSKIIVLRQTTVNEDDFGAISFSVPIDLTVIPPRAEGLPYYIRVTVDDLVNPRVHQYAAGTINVVELASGTTDLFDIGRTVAGARWYGFSPGAQLGSSMTTLTDFDADGVDDFVLVARYGNPRNYGLIGEAYGIYGLNGIRFGGSIGVNSVADVISGVIFEAPPVRTSAFLGNCARDDAYTEGITDVNFLPDMNGDGRPEIIFALPHVHCAMDAMDYDPDDADLAGSSQELTVQAVFRDGEVETTIGQEPPDSDFTYRGVLDTYIDSSVPNASFGSSSELSWRDQGAGQRSWSLLKFTDVIARLPDETSNINVASVRANLQLRVFRIGGQGTLHRVLTDFDEFTTFADFSVTGGEPVGGELNDADIDYVVEGGGAGGIGSVDANQPDIVQVDVSDVVQLLLDGELLEFDNELRFIIVPDQDEGADEAAIRASEFFTLEDRPTLTITYNRRGGVGALECYPDRLVNNQTDDDEADEFDYQWYAGGMAVTVNSTNRDNDGGIAGATRLEATSVALELVGQDAEIPPIGKEDIDEAGGQIVARADNSLADDTGDENAQEGRISGNRFTAGGYDHVDASVLNQGPRQGMFGTHVASLGDLNNDGLSEIVISSPRNEAYLAELRENFGFDSTHLNSTRYSGSITVYPGTNYNDNFWREEGNDQSGNAVLPFLDQQHRPPFGSCRTPVQPRSTFGPSDAFEIFAEHPDDSLGGASSAGDFNQDGVGDILCGAPGNDRSIDSEDTGALYVIYGRQVIGDFDLADADDPFSRPPMLRIRGDLPGDQIGWRQTGALDVNGDRINDIVFSSPTADFGGVRRTTCIGSCDPVVCSGQPEPPPAIDLTQANFNSCQSAVGDEVFCDDPCKVFDFDNDTDIDEDDQSVLACVSAGGSNCCSNRVDNGVVGIVYGGVFLDGDRVLSQLARSDVQDLPGVIFYGSRAGHRAGFDVSSAGDFNQDGFGDIMISAPGEIRCDSAGRPRAGVVYVIFGGTHLANRRWSLAQVGSSDLPGIVFLSPYVSGRPNEAAPLTVRFLGDLNNDGFGDIGIGNPKADFIDFSFPQGPDATDASVGRRRNAGDVYVIYGNNFGTNRELPREP